MDLHIATVFFKVEFLPFKCVECFLLFLFKFFRQMTIDKFIRVVKIKCNL